jgi:hypothetical protein
MKIALTIILCLVFSAFASAGSWQFLGLGGRNVISLETDPPTRSIFLLARLRGYIISDDGAILGAYIPYNVARIYLANYPYDSDIVIKLYRRWFQLGRAILFDQSRFYMDVIAYLMIHNVGFDPIEPPDIYSLMDGILTSSNFGQSVPPPIMAFPN